MSISQFFILSPRGDTIIYRDFCRDLKKGTSEIFLRKVKFWDEDDTNAPPFFNVEGINFAYSKKFDLFFVFTSKDNFSPSYFLEVLDRLMKVIKDHCGILNEEAIRKNFILIYEIIDEMIDYGLPQLSSTEQIKPFVFTEPIVVSQQKISGGSIFNKNTISSNAVNKPMSQTLDKKKKNEIFIDLFEKLTVVFNSKGNIINSSIDGCIQMKSYLKDSPELKLVLNEDLVIGKQAYGSSLAVDDCNFHSCANLKEFESQRAIYLYPPDGEFILMNYRITKDFTAPFLIYTYIEEKNYKLEFKLRIQANFSDKYFASNVIIKFAVPKSTNSNSCYMECEGSKIGQATDYIENEKTCYWRITKFQGGTEQVLTAKVTVPNKSEKEGYRKEFGPVSMNFEIPNYNISKIQIKELKINAVDKNYEALRWVRHITQASSYVARIS